MNFNHHKTCFVASVAIAMAGLIAGATKTTKAANSNPKEVNVTWTDADAAGRPIKPVAPAPALVIQSKKVMHTDNRYTGKGKKVKSKLTAGKTIYVFNKVMIKGHKYYDLGDGTYFATDNIDGTNRQIKHVAHSYDRKGNSTTKTWAKDQTIRTYGAPVRIHGKAYYSIGTSAYIKKSSFK